MFHPKADEFGNFHCALCQRTSANEEEFNLTYFITPMCKRCFSDGMTYGWD